MRYPLAAPLLLLVLASLCAVGCPLCTPPPPATPGVDGGGAGGSDAGARR